MPFKGLASVDTNTYDERDNKLTISVSPDVCCYLESNSCSVVLSATVYDLYYHWQMTLFHLGQIKFVVAGMCTRMYGFFRSSDL